MKLLKKSLRMIAPFLMFTLLASSGFSQSRGGAFAILGSSPVFGQPQTRSGPWTQELTDNVKSIGSVKLSPDGTLAAYVSYESKSIPENEAGISHLYLKNLSTQSEKTIESCAGVSDPSWSPRGRSLAYVCSGAIYLWEAASGKSVQLTKNDRGVGSYMWSPDGLRMAFTSASTTTTASTTTRAPSALLGAHWEDGSNSPKSHLFLIELKDKKEQAVVTEDYNVTEGDFDWSTDGRSIVFSHTQSTDPNDWLHSSISIVNIETSAIRHLSAGMASASQPHFSPSGKSLALVLSEGAPVWYRKEGIYVVSSALNTQPRKLKATFDQLPTIIGWLPDERHVLFYEAKGTSPKIYILDCEADEIRAFSSGGGVIGDISLGASGKMLGYTYETPNQPPEAYVSPVERFSPTRISDRNEDLPSDLLGQTRILQWESSGDRKVIEGLLTVPAAYDSAKSTPSPPPPLIIMLHGGPAGAFWQTYNGKASVNPVGWFVSRGYAVLRPNPRGSLGYGADFRAANQADWGGGDYLDVMSGLDKIIAMGIADPARVGVMGWSYGGYLAATAITKTQRFKAASIGAGITDLTLSAGTSIVSGLIPGYFGVYPWEAPETYVRYSPIYAVGHVSTPTLIIHGESDPVVPIAEAYEFFHGLQKSGISVRMLVLDNQGHFPRGAVAVRTLTEESLDWMDKYVKTPQESQTTSLP
jgi:dipeptidyl aminopeptidase/acylaminoacyl peptidase